MPIPRVAWTAAQIAVIQQHPELYDEELVEMVNALGPSRTASGIAEFRRRKLRIMKKRRATKTPEHRAVALRGLQAAREQMDGWPTLHGKPAQRERRYLRLLFEGLAAETNADRVTA